jgi:hypothetical protein
MRAITIAVAAISLLVIAPTVYMLADDQPPYEYDVENSYVVPRQTRAGHQVTVHWKLSRINRVCPGVIIRTIVDALTGVRTTYDPAPAATTIDLMDNELNRTFLLPSGITPGSKWYYSDAEYACNPLQRFYPLKERTPRLSFDILP